MKKLRPLFRRRRDNRPSVQATFVLMSPTLQLCHCRDEFSAARSGYHNQQREILAKVYSSVLALQVVDDEWERFVNDGFWDLYKGRRPCARDRGNPWLFAVVFVRQPRSEGSRKLASKHARALWLLAQENVAPDEIPSAIRSRGGIQKLASAAAELRSESRSEPRDESAVHGDGGGTIEDHEPRALDKCTSDFVEGSFRISAHLASAIRDRAGSDIKLVARVSATNALKLRVIHVLPSE